MPDNQIRALAVGPDGSLWIGTSGGLTRLDKDGNWQIYGKVGNNRGSPDDGVDGLPEDVATLAVGPDGSLWIGTSGGLTQLGKDGHWQTYNWANTKDREPYPTITLALGQDDSIWVGTYGGGLARLDKDGQWQTYSRANTKGGLPEDKVSALVLGQDGSLWVGTDGGGLARFDKDGQWQTYSRANTKGGLPDDRVSALVLGQDGSLWVGTDGGGLARFDKDGHWQTYSQDNTNRGLPVDQVSALALAPDGSLWVGTFGGGLARLDQDGHWQTYNWANTKDREPYAAITLALGQDDSIWVGTYGGGLARLDKDGHWQIYSNIEFEDDVLTLAVGPDGTPWAGTRIGGLVRFDNDGHRQTYRRANTNGGLPDGRVLAVALAPDGSLWVGTSGGGLARLDKDGHWQTYSTLNTNGGLPDDQVSALALAPDGSLWVGTSGGLGHLNRAASGTLRITDVIGKAGEVTQAEQTVAVVAFDGSYLTPPGMFRYIWRKSEIGLLGFKPGPEIKTKSSAYRAIFDHDGAYQLRVIAVDRYGNRSDPKDINFKVTLPRPKSLWDTLASVWQIVLATAAVLYALTLTTLLLMTRRSAWAFRILTDAAWAKWLTWPFFFLRHMPAVQRWVLEPWFQAVRRSTPTDIRFLDPPVSMKTGSPSGAAALLHRLGSSPRLWLHGQSGMGKSSVFAAWERAYFAAEDAPNLNAAVRRYGFILITLPLRQYAAIPVPEPNRPESWILEAVRRQLEQYGVATSDIGLIDAMLRAGHIALALDGTNEVDRDLALAAFASQYPQVRLLATSQALPRNFAKDERWEVWKLPEDIGELRNGLLALWLGDEKGATLSRRIVAEGLFGSIVSGYDLRLLADLAAVNPEHAPLPGDRVALYRAMLARASGPDGQPLRLEGLEQLAWTLVTQRRRRIMPDDKKVLGVATLQALEREGLRIVRQIGAEQEFRHDQMRAFLAALWLIEEMPTLPALQKTAIDAGAFGLNRRDQDDLWRFVAPLLTSGADLEALWQFANDDPVDRAILLDALQAEADKRGVTLVRVAKLRQQEMV